MASTPPEWPVRRPRPKPRTLWSDLGGLWQRFRGLPFLPQLIIGLLVTIIAVAVISIPFRSSPTTTVTIRTSTTLRPVATSSTSTSTTKPIPAGDDKVVKTVIDGDSFETNDGIKVRLLGVDAPDIETADCFSAEATTHLQSLIGPLRSVRLVYDTSKTERNGLGRTLAYVYRLPDGLFLNLAMAQDGFMSELKVAPNTAHADELAAAITEARTAKKGMWATCGATTTTAAPSATTTTARATTTAPGATTTTTPAATTTTTTAATSTTTTTAPLPVVTAGTLCTTVGARGVFADGKPAVCTSTLLGPTWQPA